MNKFIHTSLHDLSKHANISFHRGTIPSLVFELFLAFLYTKFRAFSNANHNIGILSAKLSLEFIQASDVMITHYFGTQGKHFRHKPRDIIK